MAILKIRPDQDTFITSNSLGESASFGGDEILELGACSREGSAGLSRILLYFPYVRLPEHSDAVVTLNLKCASAENLPSTYTVTASRPSQHWVDGTGHVQDIPGVYNGATWEQPNPFSAPDIWWEGGEGGGNRAAVIDNPPLSDCFQHFSRNDESKDISIEVSSLYPNMYLNRNGILLKFASKVTDDASDEELEELGTRLSFFSRETHTIYAPYLEVAYDDSINEASSSLENLDGVIVGTRNLKEHYYLDEQVRIDLSVKPEFPVRVFSTSSLYRDLDEALPEDTLWGIRDEYTGEMVVPFNYVGTKISYDINNFIILNTSLLEPERYYRLLIKGPSSGGQRILDTKNIFRIVRNG